MPAEPSRTLGENASRAQQNLRGECQQNPRGDYSHLTETRSMEFRSGGTFSQVNKANLASSLSGNPHTWYIVTRLSTPH